MDHRYIRRENVRRYKELLKRTHDRRERERIEALLAEERQKQREEGDRLDDE